MAQTLKLTERRNDWNSAALAFGGLALVIIVLTLPVASDMVRIWLSSSLYHQGLLAIPGAVWMIVAHSERPHDNGSRKISIAIAVLAALVFLIGRAASAGLIEQAGLVMLIIAAVGAVYGDNALKCWIWPLLFLFFAVPAGESLLPVLQQITASIAIALLQLAGLNVSLDGFLIQTSVGTFAVAEACAGLRFFIAMLMISAVFAYTSYRGASKRIVFMVTAGVVAIAVNALRVVIFIAIPVITQSDPSLGADHYLIGAILYLIGLVALFAVGRRYADRRLARTPTAPPAFQISAILSVLILTTAAASYAHFVVERGPAHNSAVTDYPLPNVQGWRILPAAQNWAGEFRNPDSSVNATYDAARQRVYFSHGFYSYDRYGAEIASGLNRSWDGESWKRSGKTSSVLFVFGRSEEMTLDTLTGPEQRKLAALTIYWLGDEIYFDRRAVKWAQARRKLTGRNDSGGVIILAASYRRNPKEAIDVIRQFGNDLELFRDWQSRAGRP